MSAKFPKGGGSRVIFDRQSRRSAFLLGIIIFIRRIPPSNFVVVTFLLTSLRKVYFLRRRLRRYRFLMTVIAVLMFLFLYSVARVLAEFQCKIDLCMMDRYNSSSIMLTIFTKTSPLRTSAPLRKHMWATMDQRYVPLSFQ